MCPFRVFKPKDLSVSESEERGHGEGVVYGTLMVSDTQHPHGHAKEVTRPGRTHKKTKDL